MAKPKLIFFDLDGTLVDGFEYIYQHLWEYFGVDLEQPRRVLKQYLSKEITYEQWVNNDVRLLQEANATKPKILEAIKLLKPMKGAIKTLEELRRRGYKIFIVSGGIDLVVEAVYPGRQDLFDGIFINRYFFDETGIITHAEPTKYDMENKATCITDTAKAYGLEAKDCTFIGDNVNDIEAAMVAGKSIAFNSKSDELAQIATHHVESNDLTDTLKYL